MSQKQLVVVGGGAAGFFCAVNAARMNAGLKVMLIEKTGKLLSKVKISGGGRCNVTHACFDLETMAARYPRGARFLKKSFHQFFTKDTIAWFEQRGVKLKTEEDGRMFPVTDNSQTIIDCLLSEATKHGVEILMHTAVQSITNNNNQFRLVLNGDRIFDAEYVCIASGGYAKAEQFGWLQDIGHSIELPVPSLFTFNIPGNPITTLMGVSVERAVVKIVGTKLQQEGPVMITNWGLSGPAVLVLSAWAARELAGNHWHFKILVNWLPAYQEQELRQSFQQLRKELAGTFLFSKNPFGLPQRLWILLLEESGIGDSLRWSDLPGANQNRLIRNLNAQEFDVQGKTTFKQEFVTAGGIRLSEIEAHTMQSKKRPGLYFAGEVMDIDGITGGYNFQHAWTSGFIAAKSIALAANS